MGVSGGSSPASLEAHDMEPAEGEGEIQEERLEDHDVDGARPLAEMGV
jgi:hypothetical protein